MKHITVKQYYSTSDYEVLDTEGKYVGLLSHLFLSGNDVWNLKGSYYMISDKEDVQTQKEVLLKYAEKMERESRIYRELAESL